LDKPIEIYVDGAFKGVRSDIQKRKNNAIHKYINEEIKKKLNSHSNNKTNYNYYNTITHSSKNHQKGR